MMAPRSPRLAWQPHCCQLQGAGGIIPGMGMPYGGYIPGRICICGIGMNPGCMYGIGGGIPYAYGLGGKPGGGMPPSMGARGGAAGRGGAGWAAAGGAAAGVMGGATLGSGCAVPEAARRFSSLIC